jgi:Family of unknown function (DUF6176)
MMDVACHFIALKPGSLPVVRQWATTMNERLKEVLATLHAEAVDVESVFLLTRPEGDYLVYYMRAKNLELAKDVAQASPHAIDAIHRAFKKATWMKVEKTELLLDASTLANSDGRVVMPDVPANGPQKAHGRG